MKRMRFWSGWMSAAFALMLGAEARVSAQAPQWAFRVSFSDKAGSPDVANPSAFLTARALARRSRLSIPVDDADRPVSPLYIDTALQLSGGVLHTTSRWLNNAVLLLTDSARIGLVAARPWVKDVRVVGYYAVGLHSRATDPKRAAETMGTPAPPLPQGTTGSAAYYGSAWAQTDLVRGDALHDAGFHGEGMLIAVLDEGFAELNTHPGFANLRNEGRLVDSFSFVKRSRDGLATGSYHGTMALSTMAGFLPNTYVGSAHAARYAVYASEEGGNEQPIELDNMVAATERADSIGADIVHASLGYNTFNYPAGADLTYAQLDGKTTVAAQAANIAVAKGMLFVASAGNEGNSSFWNYILTPGDADSALTVGNVLASKTPASNSGYGPNSAGRVKPDVAALGQPASVFAPGGSIGSYSGTSFSTPQIAGWAACLWQAHPQLRPGQVRDFIQRSADHYPTPGKQDGYGVPDFGKARTLGVDNRGVLKTGFAVVTNPFDAALELHASLALAATVTADLYDVTGRALVSQTRSLPAGSTGWSLPVPASLPAGIYVLRLRTEGEGMTFRVLHQ